MCLQSSQEKKITNTPTHKHDLLGVDKENALPRQKVPPSAVFSPALSKFAWMGERCVLNFKRSNLQYGRDSFDAFQSPIPFVKRAPKKRKLMTKKGVVRPRGSRAKKVPRDGRISGSDILDKRPLSINTNTFDEACANAARKVSQSGLAQTVNVEPLQGSRPAVPSLKPSCQSNGRPTWSGLQSSSKSTFPGAGRKAVTILL